MYIHAFKLYIKDEVLNILHILIRIITCSNFFSCHILAAYNGLWACPCNLIGLVNYKVLKDRAFCILFFFFPHMIKVGVSRYHLPLAAPARFSLSWEEVLPVQLYCWRQILVIWGHGLSKKALNKLRREWQNFPLFSLIVSAFPALFVLWVFSIPRWQQQFKYILNMDNRKWCGYCGQF